MSRHFYRLSLLLLLTGMFLAGAGVFAMSNATPLGAMDCGCGGAQACVTKRKAVNSGAVLVAVGGFSLLGGLLLGAHVRLARRAAG